MSVNVSSLVCVCVCVNLSYGVYGPLRRDGQIHSLGACVFFLPLFAE